MGTSQRHTGVWTPSAYKRNVDLAGINGSNLSIWTQYAIVDGLQISARNTATHDMGGLVVDWDSAWVVVSNNIIKDVDVDDSPGVGLRIISPTTSYVFNNLIYDFIDNGRCFRTEEVTDISKTVYLYNNTAINCHWGGFRGSVRTVAKNNIAHDSALSIAFANGTWHGSSNYNVSDDASNTGGANSQSSVEVTFESIPGDNFHLGLFDTTANNQGVDLSSDPNLPIARDIDGQLRTGVWDVGADHR